MNPKQRIPPKNRKQPRQKYKPHVRELVSSIIRSVSDQPSFDLRRDYPPVYDRRRSSLDSHPVDQ